VHVSFCENEHACVHVRESECTC